MKRRLFHVDNWTFFIPQFLAILKNYKGLTLLDTGPIYHDLLLVCEDADDDISSTHSTLVLQSYAVENNSSSKIYNTSSQKFNNTSIKFSMRYESRCWQKTLRNVFTSGKRIFALRACAYQMLRVKKVFLFSCHYICPPKLNIPDRQLFFWTGKRSFNNLKRWEKS